MRNQRNENKSLLNQSGNSGNSPAAGSDKRLSGDDLPGYPHYPPNEDIMNPGNGAEKVGTDVEELANSKRLSGLSAGNRQPSDQIESEISEDYDDLGIVEGTEADVTKDDLLILGDAKLDMDLGEDEAILEKAQVDLLDDEGELDMPGTELDDDNEAIGEEDEENNYYSLGGDRHESLEEDPS